jgi:hypothetical protein
MIPKTVLVCLLTLSACVSLFAQDKDIPAFGKVEKTELEMKECDFDKNADAVVLFDAGELYCDIGSMGVSMDVERHVRIKILKDKGLHNADIHIPYYSYGNNESVKNITAQTYNLDATGNIVATKVDKKLIYNKQLNKRYSEEVFTFPEVKAGSVIEYKYKLTNAALMEWYFQRSIPVKFSRYKTSFPTEIEVYATPLCTLPFDSKKDPKSDRNVNLYTMKNVPALRDEPYISCEDDYLQRIQTKPLAYNPPSPGIRQSLLSAWPKIIQELMEDEDFGKQLKKDIPRTADLDEQLKKLSDPYQKMVTIHEYVRKNMKWNEYDNIWALDGVKSAWKDKKGTTGEINLILVNLLKDAGLKASPILVSTQDHGRVNTSDANWRQFNKVLAYVKLDGNVYVLDGTEKYTPSRLIPLEVMTTEGLVIEKPETFEWGWKILWNDKQLFRNVTLLNATINGQDIMEGDANVTSYNYSRIERMPTLKKGKNELLAKYFTASQPGCTADSLELENEETDSLPLVQKVKFTMPVSTSGNYKYFSLNLFTGLEKNPFIADSRFSDVFFGANQSHTLIANLTIPEGYVFETLPRNIRMITPDTSVSFTRRFSKENNQLMAQIQLDFKRPFYSVNDYPDFKEFYKKMVDMLNEQIAIRKEN